MSIEKGPPPEETGIKIEGTGLEAKEQEELKNYISENINILARNMFGGQNEKDEAKVFSPIITDVVKEEIETIESQPKSIENKKAMILDLLLNKLRRGLENANTIRNPDEVLNVNYDPNEEGHESYIQKKDLPVILKGLIAGDLLKLNVTDGMHGSSPRIGMTIRRFSELRDIPPQEAIEKFQNILQQTRNHLEAIGKGSETYLDSELKEWGFKWDINKNSYTYHEKKMSSLHEAYPQKF